MRALLALLLVVLLAGPGAAEPAPGLLRVATALPRTLPLVIRSPAGQAAVVRLLDAATGAEVLAVYVPGGGPQRVLVPPGRFLLEIVTGQGWQGAGFAQETGRHSLGPLAFAITGHNRKSGHVVTLDGAADARAFALCQHPGGLRTDRQLLPERLEPDYALPRPDTGPGAPPQPILRTLPCG